jgi:hypothetical protein
LGLTHTDIQTREERSRLFCWYERNSDLAWLINPLKIEALSWDPYVIQIYDVIGDKMADTLKSPTHLNMERTSTFRYGADGSATSSEFSSHRTSSSTTLDEDKISEETREILQSLDSKIGRMTQLVVSNAGETPPSFASEPIQISSYAFGGQVKPHLDSVSLL